MNKEAWYYKVLTKYKKEAVNSALILLTFIVSVTLYVFLSGESYKWQQIEFFDQPTIFTRLLYSALVFVTIGAFLYKVGFYKFLYSLYRGTKNGWREYQKMKSGIWGMLILLMFFVIVPFVVNLLNGIASLLFNFYKLLLYLLPSVVITITIIGIVYFIRKKLNVM